MATWFPVPGVIRRAHASTSDTTTATATTPVDVPSRMPRAEATTTPTMTPTLRSSAFPNDWFRLGWTTRSAAIAANTGGCAGMSQPARNHASTVATADLAT